MRPIRTEADLDALLRGAKALAVVAAWHENGLFDALRAGPRDLDTLSADARALATTVPVLKHLGLLHGEGDRVALTPTGASLLDAGALARGADLEGLSTLGQMGEIVRRGGPVRDRDGVEQVTDGGVRIHDPVQSARFLDMLYRRSEASAEQCFEWLAPHVPAGAPVLDVGGGHGRYVRRFVDAGHPGALFDFPHVVDYASARHGDHLTYWRGNFRDPAARFGEGYGLILLSNIVHGEPAAENAGLLRRLARCLAPGGLLVLKDMFLDAHGDAPENAVFFGLVMLYHTRAGQSPRLTDAEAWMRDAGLGELAFTTFEGFQLLRGRRGRGQTPPLDT